MRIGELPVNYPSFKSFSRQLGTERVKKSWTVWGRDSISQKKPGLISYQHDLLSFKNILLHIPREIHANVPKNSQHGAFKVPEIKLLPPTLPALEIIQIMCKS